MCAGPGIGDDGAVGQSGQNTGLQVVEAKIEKIIVFWWNRHYPSDRKFDLDLSKWNKVSEEEFAGYSHEKITKEVYEK